MNSSLVTALVIGAPVPSFASHPPAGVSEVGHAPEYFQTPAVGGRADATYTSSPRTSTPPAVAIATSTLQYGTSVRLNGGNQTISCPSPVPLAWLPTSVVTTWP